MECSKCGFSLRPTAKVCIKCGTPVSAAPDGAQSTVPPPAAESEPVTAGVEMHQTASDAGGQAAAPQVEVTPAGSCASCGLPLKPSAKFCIKCGTPVWAAPQSGTTAPAQPIAPVVAEEDNLATDDTPSPTNGPAAASAIPAFEAAPDLRQSPPNPKEFAGPAIGGQNVVKYAVGGAIVLLAVVAGYFAFIRSPQPAMTSTVAANAPSTPGNAQPSPNGPAPRAEVSTPHAETALAGSSAPVAPAVKNAPRVETRYECRNATAWEDFTVCNSASLREADRRLAAKYQSLLRAAPTPAARSGLVASQGSWMQKRRSCAVEADPPGCLQQLYAARLVTIEQAGKSASGQNAGWMPSPAVADRPAIGIGGTHTFPPYPASAAQRGKQGNVTLALSISAHGDVDGAHVVESSGTSDLDNAAVDWVVKRWKYQPAIRNGVATASTTSAQLVFRLSNAGSWGAPRSANVADSPPESIKSTHTAPPYPASAYARGIEGRVGLKLSISDTGDVTNAWVISSSGSEELDNSAVNWVRLRWKYKPAVRNGSAVPAETSVELLFKR